ncbi:MAG: hypothetical protein H6652_16890 [Ardenticatenaceae bacterium]|nr:hypothetical protein [Ardenticatenaceae bacterium]
MKSRHLLFLLVLLMIFTACNENGRPTPTPFPENESTEEALNPLAPLAISISDLAADPEAYAQSFVEITGQYRRLPLLVCDSDPHPAPATWQLVAEDGSLVAIGGFDSQVRSLLPNDLTMTVAGVWQLFDGPVGCGKNASSQQIWYLKASDILSPSPIARVTLTPTGSGTQIAETDDGTAVATPDNQGNLPPTPTTDTGDETDGQFTSTPTSASTTVPAPPGGTAASTATPTSGSGGGPGSIGPTNTPAGSDNETNTPTPTSGAGTPTASNGTPTPTSSSGGNGSPTPTTNALSTATRNPTDFDVVEFDDLSPELPVLELLAEEETHLWPILFDNTAAITITAVSEPSVDLVLEILDPANSVVEQANSGGSGAVESIVNAQLNVALDYKIRVYNLNGTAGEYCLIFSEEGGFPDSIKGRIDYGQTVNNTIETLAINYWCFMGSSGDTITISSSATGNTGDFVVGLFGPPDFDAIGTPFAGSEITNVTLTEDSMYLIGILDFDAGETGYSLTLNRN